MMRARWVTEVTVTDPDTGGAVEVAVYKCQQSGGMFGIDVSFLASGGDFQQVDMDDDDSGAIILSPFVVSEMVLPLSDDLKVILEDSNPYPNVEPGLAMSS